MSSSGDSFLLSLLLILIPAIGLLVGTVLYTHVVLKRYSKALSRLYRSSFKGVDSERRRIASELHDHLGGHTVLISGFFETIKFKSYQDCESEIEHLERAFKKFCNETHKIVEYMYPIGLHDSDWTSSFKQLAEQLSTNEVVVDFESLGDKTPSSTLLQHTYWAVHEIVINAIKHSKAHRLQISLVSETTDFTITILYKASSQSLKWLNNRLSTNLGYGTSIIKDRLKIIDATYEVHAINGFVSHIIRLPYENPTA